MSARRKPWDSPSNARYAYGMSLAATASAKRSDCGGETTGSSMPCSSSTGQAVPEARASGERSSYVRSNPGTGPISPYR